MSLIKKICFLSVFLCFLVFLEPESAHAQAKDLLHSYLVELPKVEMLSQEQLDEISEVYKYAPEEKDAMAFTLNVPKGWINKTGEKDSKDVFSKEIISEIVTFVSPARLQIARSELSVEYAELAYQTSTQHWVLQYLISRGLTSKGMEVVNEKRTEFFYVDVESDLTFGVHAVAEINGNKLFLTRYRLPIEAWDEEKNIQKSTVSSFEFLNPVDDMIEALLDYQFLDLALIKYPRSWRQKAKPIRSIDRMEVGFFRIDTDPLSEKRILAGRIDANMVSYSVVEDVDKEIDAITVNLLGERLVLGEEMTVSEASVPAKFIEESDVYEKFSMRSYVAENKAGRSLGYEFWVTSVLVADYYYFFTMLTPSREDSFFSWSRNLETYKVLLKSFDPNLDNAVYEE